MKNLILRSELKNNERRTPLTPDNAKRLIEHGVKISVEKSSERIFPDNNYSTAGCTLVEPQSWKASPRETIILGLKELAANDEPHGDHPDVL